MTTKLEPLDQNNLDKILVRHAYEFQDAIEDLPALHRERDEAKLELDRVESRLYLQIRKRFEDEGEKFTEGKILATIKTNGTYIEMQNKFYLARQKYEEKDLLKTAYLQREGALKLLVSLFNSSYWSLDSIKAPPRAKKSKKKSGFKTGKD